MTLIATEAPTRYRFTRDEFERMEQVGIFHEDDPVELIDGEVMVMAAIGRRHMTRVVRLTRAFSKVAGDRALVSVQNPVGLTLHDGPQPDVVLLRFREDLYETGAEAGPQDVLLIIEVADSSLQYDRTTKARLYAQRSVPEYWILNLTREELIVHRNPSPNGYREVETLRRDHGAVRLAADSAIEVDLAEVLLLRAS